jgi:hypothetical protein
MYVLLIKKTKYIYLLKDMIIIEIQKINKLK